MKEETTVINRRLEDGETVYIGRKHGHPHHYGNPFIIGLHGTREGVITKFDLWLRGVAYQNVEPERCKWIPKNLHLLQGGVLGCWCKPKPCHGDVYIQLLKEMGEKEK